MPRTSRHSVKSLFFHAMVQGIEKKFIFDNPVNMQKYIDLIDVNAKKTHVTIFSYCIMSNHAHILIHVKNIDDMVKFFRCVNTAYARYFNCKNKRVGYVFRDRYKTESIYTVQQLINAINYIHNNPVNSGICSFPEEYEYSSYKEYSHTNKIVNKEILYKHFGEENFKIIFLNRD